MDKERLGALIDAVYAIAMTILVLELPIPESGNAIDKSISTLFISIADYGLTFIILFAFWYNQRRINDLVLGHSRLTLWLNGFAIMTICLIPFSANLLYKYGGESSSLFQLNHAALADIVFIIVCLSADLLIHLSLTIASALRLHAQEKHDQVLEITRARKITTIIVVLVMFLTFVLPGPNRRSLIAIPLLLIFEEKVTDLWEWILRVKQSNS